MCKALRALLQREQGQDQERVWVRVGEAMSERNKVDQVLAIKKSRKAGGLVV